MGYLVRPTDTDGAYNQIETFHSLPENSLDVIVYGSSHAFRGNNTKEMYDKYGIKAYNYGWNWQKISTTKLFIQDSYLTQNPKVALIESFYASTVLKDTDITAEIYYCNYIHDKQAKKAYMKQCLGKNPSLERRLSYVMPLTIFHDNWISISKQSFEKLVSKPNSELVENRGFSASDQVTPVEIPDYTTVQQTELSEDALKELTDIVNICNKNNTSVIFYTAPWQGEYAYRDAMKKLADENNCVYLDLFEHVSEIGLNEKTDFSDTGHLNTSGATKVADYLGKYLVDNYGF